MRDSCIFYRSFLESIELLPKKYQLAFFTALFNYALNDEPPANLSGSAAALFKALQPQIDANTRKYENGCKGGRPKQNQEETKPKPSNNLNKSKPKRNVNDNDNDNENVNENENYNYNALGSSGGGGEDKYNIFKLLGGEGIDAVYNAYPESGGYLIQEVYEDVMSKKKTVKNPVAYVLGYAKKVKWDDKADHFTEAM